MIALTERDQQLSISKADIKDMSKKIEILNELVSIIILSVSIRRILLIWGHLRSWPKTWQCD